MTAHEKLSEARAHLAFITTTIEGYSLGDRPQSPPVSLLREERRIRAVVAWWQKEVDRLSEVSP